MDRVTGLIIRLIRGYQRFLSRLFRPACRFHPTCSAFAIKALERHGLIRGSWLACKRIVSCHPLHPGGHDPVPDKQ